MNRKQILLTGLSVVLVFLLSPACSWIAVAQEPEEQVLPAGHDLPHASAPPTAAGTWYSAQTSDMDRLAVLLWPKHLSQFVDEYSSWELWLSERQISAYSPRNELVVSGLALAMLIPDLEIETDEPNSDLVIVSGSQASIDALLERMRDHPLLARVTEDSRIHRDEARTAWTASRLDWIPDASEHVVPAINIRNNWLTNLVWGYSLPDAKIDVILTRSDSQVLTTTARANSEGLYHAYLAWEIREGDTVEIHDGTEIEKVSVGPLRVSSYVNGASVMGLALPSPGTPPKTTSATLSSLEVAVGGVKQGVRTDNHGLFVADFSDKPFRQGARGFLRYTDGDGNRTFAPFGVPIVNVRRDTSYDLPYGSVHSVGISSIVWGNAVPEATLVITLIRAGSPIVTRTVTPDQIGDFAVSLDRLIEDGDIVQVSDGLDTRNIQIPAMTFHANPTTRIVTGTAPEGITTTTPDAPHSLRVSIAGNSRQVTTTAGGEYSAEFTDSTYLAGLLGTMCYTTSDGDRVYKPVFVADPLVRGHLGDWRGDIILGQPDFTQITPNEVVGNGTFNPGGVYVDRSVQPNRVYVYDSGNSRILGFEYLGYAQGGPGNGQPCTSDSDHPDSTCLIQPERPADIILGQPSPGSSSCNTDSGYQLYPDVPMADASLVCGLREEQNSISEGWSGATMTSDAQGNFYVTDVFNNRVLRYNSPFTTDVTADFVWGQADFAGIHCNRGAGFFAHTDARSLCLAAYPGYSDLQSGVEFDPDGNLWVADQMNNRVLRFPFSAALGRPAAEADLVLGQPDFSTISRGAALDQMDRPASVRVDVSGKVYVADSLNSRVLLFEPPLSNGMPASDLLDSGLQWPLGLEFDLDGGIWVSDLELHQALHFVEGIVQHALPTQWLPFGGMGVDVDGNLMMVSNHQVQHYSPPTYDLDAVFLESEPSGVANRTGARGFYGGLGLEVTDEQLIYSDWSRILFWGSPWDLDSYEPADGVIGEPDFQTREGVWIGFGRMRADRQGWLWVINGGTWREAKILAYELPLTTGATPLVTLESPLPLQGGGSFTWTKDLFLGGIDVQPDCDCLWLSDEGNHRVFRIRNVRTDPVVDVVLGQLSIAGNECNQGRGRDYPSQDSLCYPGALAFDGAGNLWVADHNLEVDGNHRLLEFDASVIPDVPVSAVFGIPATRVFGRDGSFSEPNCPSRTQDPMCGPWEPAFDSRGRMVVGFNSYLGPRFPMVYQDPLANPLPIAALGDLHSMPFSARFDQSDNLYVLDHNRNRILIYLAQETHTTYLPLILRQTP